MKLHLGCGKRDFGKDWIHIDAGDFPHLHSHNIIKLPFDDETADIIYASHVIEYFAKQELMQLLAEWRRVLKTGGILRIAVPDFEAICDQYEASRRISQLNGLIFGRMQVGETEIFHRSLFDEEKLAALLYVSGFNDAKRYDWKKTDHAHFDDHSQAYLPHMDKEHGRLMSLNMEATK